MLSLLLLSDKPSRDDSQTAAPGTPPNSDTNVDPTDNGRPEGVWGNVRFFSPQAWDALWSIGPVDTVITAVIGIPIAEYVSGKEYAKERHRNAFRHCYGGCLAYQWVGDDALTAMDIHEKYGGPNDGKCDSATDRFNNSVAISWVRENPDGSCYDFCTTAITSLQLMIAPGDPDSAEDLTVTAACQK